MKDNISWAKQSVEEWNAMEEGKPCPWCGQKIGYWKCFQITCYLRIFWSFKELSIKNMPKMEIPSN